MYNDLKIPLSVYKEIEIHPKVSPKDSFYDHNEGVFINKNAYDEKRSIWNNYIKTSGRTELFPIGSVVCNSSDKWPRNGYIIIDIVFEKWGLKPEITDTTTEVPFYYCITYLGNIKSLDDFIKTGKVSKVRNQFIQVDSDVSSYSDYFDSLMCSSIEDFSVTYSRQQKEIKKMLIGKHFLGWDASNAFIYDESRSRFTLKIKDVRPQFSTFGFELIPENDITIIQLKQKYESGTLSERYYDNFIKYKEKELRSPILVHIDPETNKLKFKNGYVYSDKKSINYIAHIFGSGYKYARRDINIDYSILKKDEFVMPAVTYPDETIKIVEKYKTYLKEKYIQWDYQLKGKTIKDFADNKKEHWILFDDSSFAVQKTKIIKHNTYYAPINSSAMHLFGSIHGFFKALTSKDDLNDIGEMFAKRRVFTKEEIISMAKSTL